MPNPTPKGATQTLAALGLRGKENPENLNKVSHQRLRELISGSGNTAARLSRTRRSD